MKYENFNMEKHGFVGHLAEPDSGADNAVIVIMGGEKSILPGIKIAERFAEYGFCGLAVSLYGAEGLQEGVDRIPLDMFEKVVAYLQNERKVSLMEKYSLITIPHPLCNMMCEPTVVNEVEGGHLAIMLNPEDYINLIDEFISN